MHNDSEIKELDDNSLKDLVGFLLEDWPRSAPDEIKLAPLLVYTRNMTTENVKKMFDSVSLLRRCYQEGYSEFQDTECRILNILKDASSQYGFQINTHACPNIFSLCDGTKLLSSIPNEYNIRPLEQQHADTINTSWKFGKTPQMLQRIRLWIKHSFSAGAFCSQTNELVAWGLVSEAGCISALTTKEAHRGKGLAKAIITELVRQAQNEGMTLFSYIEDENVISERIFEKLGFKRCQDGQISFFTIVP